MPYTFFTFPPEVRNMIYELLFVSKHPEKLLTPDPVGSRKSNGLLDRTIRAPDSVALLRICQHIHEEATSV